MAFLVLRRGFAKLAKKGGAVRPDLKLPMSGKDAIEIPQAARERLAIAFDQPLT